MLTHQLSKTEISYSTLNMLAADVLALSKVLAMEYYNTSRA